MVDNLFTTISFRLNSRELLTENYFNITKLKRGEPPFFVAKIEMLCYNVTMKNLQKIYDEMQEVYGSKELNSVYGGGCENGAKVALVFMNPTKRNVATSKDWQGLKAQWLGTKQVWDFLTKCGLFSEELNGQIKDKKPADWTPKFCEEVYQEVERRGVWITNLAKCSQDDARPLSDEVFVEYKDLLLKELELVSPKKVLFFGNQVASIVLNEKISVSACRQKCFPIKLGKKICKAYALFYPVGNGRFNQPKAVEDVKAILEN